MPHRQRERPGRRLCAHPGSAAAGQGQRVAGGGDQLHRRPLQHRRPGGLPDGGAGAQRGLPAHGPPAERQGAPGDRRGGEGGGGHGDRLRRRTAGGRRAEAPGVGPVSVPR